MVALRLCCLAVACALAADMPEYRVGGTVHLEEENVSDLCFQVRYRANYKPLTLSLDIGEGITQYLLTDAPHPSCDACSEDAKYCIKSINEHSQHELTLCNDWIYASFKGSQVFANITTYYNVGWMCEGIDRNPHNYCQLMGPQECIDSCDQGCSLIHCMKSKAAQTTELFSMCLPSTTPSSEIDRRCKASTEAKTFAIESCRTKEAGGLSVSWVIFLSLAIPSGIFFLANVAYYRWMMAKRGRPPFDVPDWCPQALYPRRVPEELQRFATG